jgi:hypothetical protein
MQLSILIPAIPERWAIGQRLFTKLLQMCEGKEIEILYFMDNKKRPAGEKMNSLMNISNGKYFMFCHDDDDILRIDEVYQATFQDVDVITFKQLCDSPNDAKTPYVVTFGLGNPIDKPEDFNGPIPGSFLDMRRPPWSVCAWNQKFKSIQYNGIYAEDGDWVERAIVEAKTEVFLDVIVCKYCFDPYNTSDPNTRRERPSNRPELQTPFSFIRRM